MISWSRKRHKTQLISQSSTWLVYCSTMSVFCFSYAAMLVLKYLPFLFTTIMISVSGFIPMCCLYIKKTNKIRRIADSAIELVFNRILKKYRNEEGEDSYIVLNYKAPYIQIMLLFTTLNQLIGLAVAQFWDTFLLSETFGCTANACCYSLNTFNQLLDCHNTSYLETNNIDSIICYRYVLRLGSATGSALGTITTIGIVLLIITWILLKCSKGANRTVRRGWYTVVTQVIMILTIIAVTGILIGLELETNQRSPSSIINTSCRIYPTGFTIILYIGLFQWWKFEKNCADDNQSDQVPYYRLMT